MRTRAEIQMQTNEPQNSITQKAEPGGAASNSGVVFKDGVLSVLALILACMSFMGTMWALDKAGRAETRADLAEVEVESFKNVLHSRGLPTAAHLEGESP